MRQVVLDTETTGLSPLQGHRIIEIGCLEMIHRRMTGRYFHCYLNPQCEIDPDAVQVHGLTQEFLSDKPLFADIIDEFLEFLQGSELIIHNAPFDIGFLKAELQKLGRSFPESFSIVDTLVLARRKHPGQANNLDSLCRRYGVDRSQRELHGALVDVKLLAQVYLLMTGGQTGLFTQESENRVATEFVIRRLPCRRHSLPLLHPTPEELLAHHAFMENLLDPL